MCQVGEKFLWTELSKTSNMDQQLSDSAGTATAFLEGMKRHAKNPTRVRVNTHVKHFTSAFLPIYPRSWNVFRSAPCAIFFLMQAITARSKRQASLLFTTGERHYRLIFLMTLIISSQVCSHLKLMTIGSCVVIGNSTCQCAKRSALNKIFYF